MEWSEGDGPVGMIQWYFLYHHYVPVPPTLKTGNQMDYTFNHYAYTLFNKHIHMHALIHSFVRFVFLQTEARLKTKTNFSFRKKFIVQRSQKCKTIHFQMVQRSAKARNDVLFVLIAIQSDSPAYFFFFFFLFWLCTFWHKISKEIHISADDVYDVHVILNGNDDKYGMKSSARLLLTLKYYNISFYSKHTIECKSQIRTEIKTENKQQKIAMKMETIAFQL